MIPAFKTVSVPANGSPITMGAMHKLNVPDNPIIPFIEGDGTGADIWRSRASPPKAGVSNSM